MYYKIFSVLSLYILSKPKVTNPIQGSQETVEKPNGSSQVAGTSITGTTASEIFDF